MKKTSPNFLEYFIVSFILLTVFIPAHAQTKLVGILGFGGDQFGSVYSLKNGENNFSIYDLKGNSAKDVKCDLTPPVNGKSYGISHSGGSYNGGVIFEYDCNTNTYTKKYDFTAVSSSNGYSPIGSLVLASNGKLYGITELGGASGGGVIFEFNLLNNVYTKKIDLVYATGIFPAGTLTEASNGKLYGITGSGGDGFRGVLFEYDYNSNTYTKKVDFNSSNGDPDGLNYSLTEAPNGKLYGTTRMGGLGQGTIFEYDYVSGAFTKKMDFNQSVAGGIMGIFPVGGLRLAPNGELYGITSSGGNANKGVIFEYDYINNIYKKRVDLATTDASSPEGSLLLSSNGKFYGVTSTGGSANAGVLFEYDYNNDVYTKKLDFTSSNGYRPYSSLTQTPDGKIYGMTNAGGQSGNGVIFQYDNIANAYTIKQNLFFAQEGSRPTGTLTRGANGKLYGVTMGGGINGQGVIFEYDHLNNTYTRRINLGAASADNFSTLNSLVLASNGKMYGTYFGSLNPGVLYEYDYTTGIYTDKYFFSQPTGERPSAHMLQASNGKLYGTTQMSGPGSNSQGVIYEYDYDNNTYNVKHTFYGTNGSSASFPLIQASNGKIYGVAQQGGSTGKGVLYEFDNTNNDYTIKYNFGQGNDGSYPWGGVIQANNGKLYGFFTESGTTTNGGLYEYDYNSNTYTRKLTFADTINGIHPSGELLQGTNGKLYGTMSGGGANKKGVVFEYDYNTNTYTVKRSFTALESVPYSTQLIEVPDAAGCTVTADITNNTGTTVLNCTTTSISVTATGGLSYSWDNGLGNNANATITAPGTYIVTATGDGGCTDTASIIVTQIPSIPATPATIQGPTNVCPYIGTATQLTYSVPADISATSYQWTLPATVTLISGQGTNSIQVVINNNFVAPAAIRVNASSACGTSGNRLLYLLAQFPNTPGPITPSSTNICAVIGTPNSITYTISKVTAATSYFWTAQTATTTIVHPNGPGVNDTTVTIMFTNGFFSSNLSVQAINDCGASGTRSLPLLTSVPATPGLISGPTNSCEYIAPTGIPAVYSVPNIAGITYNWTVPAGSTFFSTAPNSISVTFPNGFNSGLISVTATNGCGTSQPRFLGIGRLNPAAPGNIIGIPTDACPNRTIVYSIPSTPANSTSVLWTVPPGGILISGQGTNSITVSYPPTIVVGTVTAQSVSNCANSAIRSINVILLACAPRNIASRGNVQNTIVADLEVNASPNPSMADFKLQVNAPLKQPASVRILDIQGREMKRLMIIPGESIRFGNELKAGTYLVEVRQGNNLKTMKLVKI